MGQLSKITSWLGLIASILAILSVFTYFFGLSRLEFFIVLGFSLLSLYIYKALGDIRESLGGIRESLEKGFRELKELLEGSKRADPQPSPESKVKPPEPKIEPTGIGALGGMIIGGGLGLPFGPVGIIGNQLEYEDLKRKRGRKP